MAKAKYFTQNNEKVYPILYETHFIYSDFTQYAPVLQGFSAILSHFPPRRPRFPRRAGSCPPTRHSTISSFGLFPTISQPSGRTKVVSSMRTPNFPGR